MLLNELSVLPRNSREFTRVLFPEHAGKIPITPNVYNDYKGDDLELGGKFMTLVDDSKFCAWMTVAVFSQDRSIGSEIDVTVSFGAAIKNIFS